MLVTEDTLPKLTQENQHLQKTVSKLTQFALQPNISDISRCQNRAVANALAQRTQILKSPLAMLRRHLRKDEELNVVVQLFEERERELGARDGSSWSPVGSP